MKLKPRLIKPLFKGMLYSALFVSSIALAQGNGTLGGGQGVYVNGKLQLRDLVDPSVCTWTSGQSILNSNAELKSILQKIKSLHWFFELALRKEISNLDFCITQNELQRVYTGNGPAESIQNNGIMIYENLDPLPVAIRVRAAREVYIQKSRFEEFSPKSQALLIIHEALHTFMPVYQSIGGYYQKLFSMVKTISELTGDATERSTLEIAIRKSELNMPWSAQWIGDQSFLSYVFDTYDGRRDQLINGSVNVRELIRQRPFDYDSLSTENKARLQYVKDHLYDELFSDFCRNQDEPVLAVLRQQNTVQFNIDLYCLTLPRMMDQILDHPEQFNDGAVKQFMTNFYGDLADVTPLIKNGRVMVTKQLNQISGNPAAKPKYRYALEVHSPVLAMGRESAEIHLQQYARILVAGAMVKSVDAWLSLVKQDGAFVKAFNFNRIEKALSALSSPIIDEVPASILNLKTVYTMTLEEMVRRLHSQNLDEHADALVEFINKSNLGINVREN